MKRIVLLLAAIVFLIISCQTKTKRKDSQKQTIENYVRCYNRFDTEGMLKDLHKDIVFENYSNGRIDLRKEGIEAFKDQAEIAKKYFKMREQTIGSWYFKGDTVIVGIAYKGILAMDLPNGMKSGDTLVLTGQSEFIFKQKRI